MIYERTALSPLTLETFTMTPFVWTRCGTASIVNWYTELHDIKATVCDHEHEDLCQNGALRQQVSPSSDD
jgi:hypothetical protein